MRRLIKIFYVVIDVKRVILHYFVNYYIYIYSIYI